MIKREEQSAEHLSTLLREATSDLHFEIEMLPLARDIATGEVSRGDYFRLLGVLWHIHDLAETELVRHRDRIPPLRESMLRCEAIHEDLVFHGVDPGETPDLVADWIDQMAQSALMFPEIWLGSLYVFEGSRMGSAHLAKMLARSITPDNTTGRGLAYHLRDVGALQSRWKQFKTDCDRLKPSREITQMIVQGAVSTFRLLHDVYLSIRPVSPIVVAPG